MLSITPAEASRIISIAHFEGQGGLLVEGTDDEYSGWPISRGGAAHVGDAAARKLLLPGYPFADIVQSEPSEEDTRFEVEATWDLHRKIAERTGVDIPTSRGRLGRLLPGQNRTTAATAWVSWLFLEGIVVPEVRFLRPGDPEFEAVRQRLEEDPKARQEVTDVMAIANTATTTGRGLEISQKYQAAQTGVRYHGNKERFASPREFPVELILAGRSALRETAAEGEKSFVFDLVINALRAARKTGPKAEAVAYNLVAPLNAELLDLVTPKPRPT